jgi:hypothetical protein
MTQEEKEVIRRRFTTCLGRAAALLDVVSKQDGTNPTYPDLLDIMSLWSGLEDESIRMERKLNYFLNYDKVFIKEATFYEEILALSGGVFATSDGRRWDLPELQNHLFAIGIHHDFR